MKKILFVSIFVLCTFIGYSQYDLQFNQVLTYSGTLSGAGDSSSTFSVPKGKVWKIESMSTSPTAVYSLDGPSFYFKLNNTNIINISGDNYSHPQNFLPIWLKSGDTIQFVMYSITTNSSETYYLSIVEFNLTP